MVFAHNAHNPYEYITMPRSFGCNELYNGQPAVNWDNKTLFEIRVYHVLVSELFF